jgi:hypothetical protein
MVTQKKRLEMRLESPENLAHDGLWTTAVGHP